MTADGYDLSPEQQRIIGEKAREWRHVTGCGRPGCEAVIVGNDVDRFTEAVGAHAVKHEMPDVVVDIPGLRAADEPRDRTPDIDDRLIMSFPLPVTWWTVRQAIGAIYDSAPDDSYTGLDAVAGELRLQLCDDDHGRLDVVFGRYTDAP